MQEVKIHGPFKVVKVLFQRRYPGYLYRRELVDDSDYGGTGTLEMVCCYAEESGHWIGNARTARNLCKTRGLRKIQKAKKAHCVCSIGFDEANQRWAGWSHRAICSFGIGDKIFIERFGNDYTSYTQHGRTTIKTLSQAKLAAKRFAAYVS